MSESTPGRYRLPDITIHPFTDAFNSLSRGLLSAPTSTAWIANLAMFYPFGLLDPFTVVKAWWCSGATVGTDNFDIGVYRMTDMTTGRLDLIRSTGGVLSAGSANVVQETAIWRVAPQNITTGVDSTDATTYTTASVTLKAGRLYLLSIVNTKLVLVDAVSSIAGGATWTSRAGTDYNATQHRVSIWSGVPTADYTGTIVITFGATQTGARWSLNEFSGVDTTTTDGVVQGVVGTGTSTTPLATLAALGSANNAVFGAMANTADSTTTPGTGLTELSDDSTATTPASFLQTEFGQNDTTLDGTITSGAWGACAVEIAADTVTPFVIPPSTPGVPDLYMGFAASGATATVFGQSTVRGLAQAAGILQLATGYPLRSSCLPVAVTTTRQTVLAGFSSRTLLA